MAYYKDALSVVDALLPSLPLFNFVVFFSFSFQDPGPHGNGRYSEHMLPEIEKKDFRKGAQVYIQLR